MKAAPAARELLSAVEALKMLNTDNTRKVPDNAPTSFIKSWKNLVFKDEGMDRRYYELCVLSELKMPYALVISGFKARASSRTLTNTYCLPTNMKHSSWPTNYRCQ